MTLNFKSPNDPSSHIIIAHLVEKYKTSIMDYPAVTTKDSLGQDDCEVWKKVSISDDHT